MKNYRFSMITFYAFAPLLVIARIIQQFLLIDSKTGFYVTEFEGIAAVISWLFAAFPLILILITALGTKVKVTAPTRSLSLGCASFMLGAALFFDSAVSLSNAAKGGLTIALAISAFAAAICFVWHGLSLVTDIKFANAMMIFPVVWGLINLIAQFIRCTGQSAIIDYKISIVTLCFVLYSMLTQSKIVVGKSSKNQSAIMLLVGLSTALFCMIDTLPTFIATIIGQANNLIHDKSIVSPTVFIYGIYILLFIHLLKNDDSADEEIDGNVDEISDDKINDDNETVTDNAE
ncbi:MAG: hypothetical protein IIW79_03290 [Clostridia bacterium]|nr:hypothetical protein [Clostridia bacterium]